MYKVSPKVIGNCANLYFSVENRGAIPVNLYFSDVVVTDQDGRFVRILPKEELIDNKRSQASWSHFGTSFRYLLDSVEADEAGRTDHYSTTHDHYVHNTKKSGPKGKKERVETGCDRSTTYGVSYSQYERQMAQRQVEFDRQARHCNIDHQLADWEYGLNNFYFDSNTIFPGKEYGANFQIAIPPFVEDHIQYLVFHFNVGGEEHTFNFYCGYKEKKRWYQF
jgi:hypothetical protein